MIISPKKLQKMAKKWQKLATMNRKRLTVSTTTKDSANYSKSSQRIEKGHFVIYSADKRRFVIPLVYLKKEVFGQLLKMAEEEYGLPRDGPITLPCDAVFMEYAISLIQRHASKDMENALLMSLISARCFNLLDKQNGHTNQHFLVCTF